MVWLSFVSTLKNITAFFSHGNDIVLWTMKRATERMRTLRRPERVGLEGDFEPGDQYVALQKSICKFLFPRNFLCIEKSQKIF